MNPKTYQRIRISLFAICVTIIILAVLQVWAGEHFAIRGADEYNTERQLKSLQNENLELEDQILEAESLHTIYWKAKQMGFIENSNNVIFIR